MSDPNSFRTLIEKVSAETEVYQVKLSAASDEFEPIVSEETMWIHYHTLYKNYVKNALAGEGEFQVAGAKLHTLFFEQFKLPAGQNNPTGAAKILIDDKFGSYKKFKDSFTDIALEIHGSGWAYLDTSGKINTIPNHKIIDNVAVIIDMWEHSYIIDYRSDKKIYLSKIWSIINWDIVNARLN